MRKRWPSPGGPVSRPGMAHGFGGRARSGALRTEAIPCVFQPMEITHAREPCPNRTSPPRRFRNQAESLNSSTTHAMSVRNSCPINSKRRCGMISRKRFQKISRSNFRTAASSGRFSLLKSWKLICERNSRTDSMKRSVSSSRIGRHSLRPCA